MPHTVGPLDRWSLEALRALGDVLRHLRGSHLLTQQALADRSGLSQSTISRLENGKAPGLRIVWLARLLVSFERDDRQGDQPWWFVADEPEWVKLMQRFATNGAFARRLREDAGRHELERQERLMRLKASLERPLYAGEHKREA